MNRERGAIAIVIAVSTVFLLGLVAVAVDLGQGWAGRRHVQNGADLAALAGAVELSTGGNPQTAVNEIVSSVDTNLGPLATSEWLPASCTDPDALGWTAETLGLSPASQCISFALDFSEVRVRVPTQSVETSFAPVIGVDALSVGAEANAAGLSGFGKPPPFAVLSGFSAGEEVCLRTSSNLSPGEVWQGNGPSVDPSAKPGSVDPCDSAAMNASSQFMGTLAPPIWFDDAGGVICKQNEVAYLIAAGIDHRLSLFTDKPTANSSPEWASGGYGKPDPREVEDECGTIPSETPNTIQVTTGVTAQLLRCGLLTSKSGVCGSEVPGPAGVAGVPGRLQRGDYVQSSHEVVDEDLDNEPLWSFLRPDINDISLTVPGACRNLFNNRGNSDWDYYDKHDELIECLERWKDVKYDPIFDETIVNGARFMFAPLLAESNFDGASPSGPTSCPTTAASKCVHLNDWVPAYLNTLYISSNKLSDDCDPNDVNVGRHHAGQQFDCGDDKDNIDGASAIILACGMLPATICNDSAGNPHYPGGNPVPTITLTK